MKQNPNKQKYYITKYYTTQHNTKLKKIMHASSTV